MLTVLAATDFDAIVNSVKTMIEGFINKFGIGTFIFVVLIFIVLGFRSKR